MNNVKPLTYGDRFTLDSAPGVVWEIRDMRTVDDPAPRIPARAFPVERADGSKIEYDEAVKIGRAERVGLEIAFRPNGPGNGTPYLTTRSYVARSTDMQRDAVDAELAEMSFDFPELTDAEIVRAILANLAGKYAGDSAAREMIKSASIPQYYGDGRARVLNAIDDEHASAKIRAAMVEAFTRAVQEVRF